jgi:hypothetical protein
MKPVVGVVLGVLMATAIDAQPLPPGHRIGLASYVKASYAGLKGNLTQAADKMPEADYRFKPGSMPEVRTFGQLFGHVAEAQFVVCAAVKGVPNPIEGKHLEQDLKTKGEFVKALADSFTFCDDAFSSLTDANQMDFVRQGPGEIPRSAALMGLLAHGAEMYGVSTVYLREKGFVPPSTERTQRRRVSPNTEAEVVQNAPCGRRPGDLAR